MCLEDREQLFGEHKQQRSICTHKSRKLENPLSLISYICVLLLRFELLYVYIHKSNKVRALLFS